MALRAFGSVAGGTTGVDTRIACGPTVERILISPRAWVLPQAETRPMRAVYVLADGSRLEGTRDRRPRRRRKLMRRWSAHGGFQCGVLHPTLAPGARGRPGH